MQPAAAAASTKPGSVGIADRHRGGDPRRGEQRAARRASAARSSIRGATVVDGYENNPTANAAAFTDGWFRTGDEGMLDDDGYLFLTGRLKEQINRGGEKISPLEIDDVAAPPSRGRRGGHVRHPPRQARRGGRRRRRAAPTGRASPRASCATTCSAQLAAFKVPRTIVFVDEIPKGATGKVQRIGLADRLGL